MYCKECLEKNKNLNNNQSNTTNTQKNDNFGRDVIVDDKSFRIINNNSINSFCSTCGNPITDEEKGCTFCLGNRENLEGKKQEKFIPEIVDKFSNIVLIVGLCFSAYMVFRFLIASGGDSSRGLFIVVAIVFVLFSFMAKSFVWIIYFIIKLFFDILKKIF